VHEADFPHFFINFNLDFIEITCGDVLTQSNFERMT
jgi:hypothetical protein